MASGKGPKHIDDLIRISAHTENSRTQTGIVTVIRPIAAELRGAKDVVLEFRRLRMAELIKKEEAQYEAELRKMNRGIWKDKL